MGPQTPAGESLTAQRESGARWFYWIGGLSVVNSVLGSFSDWSFAVGIGVSQMIDGFFAGLAACMPYVTNETLSEAEIEAACDAALATATTPALAVGINVLVALGLVWIARRSMAGDLRVYAGGMALYALDALRFLAYGEAFGLVVHLLALWFLWRGFAAARTLVAAPAAGVIRQVLRARASA